MNKPTIPADGILAVLRWIDAGKVRLSRPLKSCEFQTYKASNGWTLTVVAVAGTWYALSTIVAGGRTHDLWHHLYDDDHRKDAPAYAEVRAFRPARPERYGLKARVERVKRFTVRPAVTKNGRRAYMPSVYHEEKV